ncbi:hypothetical protein, partial [Mongoliitalea lutea]|uniref:hypothetical protein n=1 Tax=Mongoliitalea lutea TaxID=849756 RepID=UPI001E486A08
MNNGTEFTVVFSNNTNAGNATVLISGTGNYTGSISTEFQILPKSIEDLTLDAIPAQTFNGSPI